MEAPHGRLLHREMDKNDCSDSLLRADAQAPAVKLGQGTRDREPEA